MAPTQTAADPSVEEQTTIFRRSVPHQVRLHEILRVLGPTEGANCLEIGSDNGVSSLMLRKHGGDWQTVAADAELAQAIGAVVGEKVHVMANGGLPFKKKLFDVVVVMDFMERFTDDVGFIEECHKVLKPDGRLVVHVTRVGTWRPVLVLRKALGLTPGKRGFVRWGYTESELFRVLKTGFDVHEVRAHTRFFVAFTEAVNERVLEARRGGDTTARRGGHVYAVSAVLYRIAFQLDFLMLLSRGYHFVAIGKRRAWRPRNAPVLVDGRSITEAVLRRAPE